MDAFTFEAFGASARSQGFDEVVERQWKPDTEVGTHTHGFAVKALVVQGEMWLSVGDDTQHLVPGDTFRLGREVAHAERYGAQGATYWAARKN
jgi:quercetin dioxygenase-like cupin family protein